MNGASIFAINDRAIPKIHIFVGNLPLREIIFGTGTSTCGQRLDERGWRNANLAKRNLYLPLTLEKTQT